LKLEVLLFKMIYCTWCWLL